MLTLKVSCPVLRRNQRAYRSYERALPSKHVNLHQGKAKEKAEYKTREYTELNAELLRDIPALLKDRSRFFDGLFANVSERITFCVQSFILSQLVDGQAQYLGDAARAMGLLSPNFSQVDRTRTAAWPFAVTEPRSDERRGGKEC